MSISAKLSERISTGLKKFQPLLAQAREKKVNESDTVILVTDMLAELFGYEKYTEITSEHEIKGTRCDLAIKFDTKVVLLIEVKRIAHELDDSHIGQAVNYAANQPVDWVVLTNGQHWRIYRVIFGKPTDHELVLELSIADLNPHDDEHVERAALLSKEDWQKDKISEYASQRRAISPFFLGAVLLSHPVLEVVRHELKLLSPGVKIDLEQLKSALAHDVIKPDVLKGEKANHAQKQYKHVVHQALKKKGMKEDDGDGNDASKMVAAPTTPTASSIAADESEA